MSHDPRWVETGALRHATHEYYPKIGQQVGTLRGLRVVHTPHNPNTAAPDPECQPCTNEALRLLVLPPRDAGTGR